MVRFGNKIPETPNAVNESAVRSYIEAGSLSELRLRLQYRVPNLHELNSPPIMCVAVTNPDVVSYIGPQRISLSKYDELVLHFKCSSPERVTECEIQVWREDNDSDGPFFRLPVQVNARKRVLGNLVSTAFMAAGTLFAALTGALLTQAFGPTSVPPGQAVQAAGAVSIPSWLWPLGVGGMLVSIAVVVISRWCFAGDAARS